MQLYGFTSLYHLQKTNQQIKKQKKQTKIKHPHNSCDLFSDRYFQSLLFPVSSVHFIALASSPGKNVHLYCSDLGDLETDTW